MPGVLNMPNFWIWQSSQYAEAVSRRCSVIMVFSLAQVFSCEFCEVSRNTFLYRTPLVSAPEYGRILTCKRYTAFWICQNMPWHSSDYILGSKYARILNIVGFWICKITQGSKYAKILLNMSEFMIIDRILNMYHTMHSSRSLYKLMSAYWETDVFRTQSKI